MSVGEERDGHVPKRESTERTFVLRGWEFRGGLTGES